MNTKTKKLLSILLSMVMLIGTLSLASVFAADKEVIDGLYVDYSGKTTVTYATDKAYSGSRSIYIDAKSDSHAWIGDPVGDFKMDPTKAYGLEFYLYVDSWTSGQIQLKPTGNDNDVYPTVHTAYIENGGAGLYLNGSNKTRWGIEKITEGEKAGWYRLWTKSAIISEDHDFSDVPGYGKGYMWYTVGEMQVYLDNINVYGWTGYTATQNSGTRSDEPIFVQDFEEEVVVAPEVTLPDADDLDVDGVNLTLASGEGYTNSGAVYGITDFKAYTGEKSLYVDSTNGKIGLGSCADDFGMVKGTAYGMKFSIYVAENSEGMLQLRPQNNKNNTYKGNHYTEISGTSESGLIVSGACKDRWTITEGTGEQAGWYRFESIYPVYLENTDITEFMPGLMFNFEGKLKAFIDDLEFYNWTKEPAAGEAFANGMGTELIGSRTFEDAVVVAPELPNAEDLDVDNVKLALNPDYSGTKAVYGITDANAFKGANSLYVDSTEGSIGLGSSDTDFGMEKSTPYGLKFSIYIAENSEGVLEIKPQNNKNDIYKGNHYTEISGTSESGLIVSGACKDRWTVTAETGEKTGWYTFETRFPVLTEPGNENAGFLTGQMFNFKGKFKAFIDEVEVYNWDKALATGDGMKDGMGTTLLASKTFEYTGDYVGKFVKAISGNNVTVSVDVRNCTKDNYTAQLFLAVYNGNTMDSIVTTGAVSIPVVDETADATTLSKTVTVPNGKTLKIFLWDSINGMRPIKKHEIYSIGQ